MAIGTITTNRITTNRITARALQLTETYSYAEVRRIAPA
jgi:hypothetical protein